MGRIETFAAVPPAAVTRVLATFDREQLEGFIAIAIDLLDLADGDPDLEEDDDPGQCTEDEISTMLTAQWASGAGCTISDPDLCGIEQHGERTTEESFYHGTALARHEDDDDEPHRVPPQWPLGDGEGFRFRPATAND